MGDRTASTPTASLRACTPAVLASCSFVSLRYVTSGCPADITRLHGYDRTSYNGGRLGWMCWARASVANVTCISKITQSLTPRPDLHTHDTPECALSKHTHERARVHHHHHHPCCAGQNPNATPGIDVTAVHGEASIPVLPPSPLCRQ